MSDAAVQRMTADEFLLWREGRAGTWELVDGAPLEKFYNGPRMMAGGRRNHAAVSGNVFAALKPRLRGGPCIPFNGDLAVRLPRGNVRQPDVSVDCGGGSGGDLALTQPKALFEVLSPSTRRIDLVRKTEEYRALPGLSHFVIMEPDKPEATVWSRPGGEGDWSSASVRGLDALLELSDLAVALPMAELYEDVELSEA